MSAPDRSGPRRVLFISYFSPPYGGPQGFRAAQFLTHLPACGWIPQLLTVKAAAYPVDSGYSDQTSYPGIRDGAIETSTLSLDRAVDRFRRGERGSAGSVSSPVAGTGASSGSGGFSLPTRVAALATTPDRLVGWTPFAVRAGLGPARRADVILAAGPPFTNHLVGLALARLAGKPLSVMVDDPWVSMTHRTWYSARQRRLHERLERLSVERADSVMAGTEGFGADLVARHPGSGLDRKLRIVRWGYEPDPELAGIQPASAPPVRFIYTGSLRGAQYDPSALFAALESMLRRDPKLAERIHLDIYGGVEPGYAAAAARPPLGSLITVHGFRPHKEISAEIRRSHVAVLLIGDTHPELRWYESAKVFTYAGAGRPTLAIVPPGGDAARLVEGRGLGLVAQSDDPEAIVEAILRLEREHEALTPPESAAVGLDSRSVISEAAKALDLAFETRTG